MRDGNSHWSRKRGDVEAGKSDSINVCVSTLMFIKSCENTILLFAMTGSLQHMTMARFMNVGLDMRNQSSSC
jgi:hypothetical protein